MLTPEKIQEKLNELYPSRNSNLFRESTATAISVLDLINERTTNLTDRNIYNERQYRERIE